MEDAREKLMPQNSEAECGVLGSVLIDPDVLDEVLEQVAPSDFHREAHVIIMNILIKLSRSGMACDFLTLCDELERQELLDQVGGASYIASLINYVPTSGNAVHYAHIVARTATARRLIRVGAEIVALGYEQDPQMLEKAQQMMFELAVSGRQKVEPKKLSELLFEYADYLSLLTEQEDKMTGIPTQFTDLDNLTGGFQKGDLVVIAGRPGTGKTSLAMDIARRSATSRKRCSSIIFSLEMSLRQLAMRTVSTESRIDSRLLKIGNINDEDWNAIVTSISRLEDLPIWITDVTQINIQLMRSVIRQHIQREGHLDCVFLDYIQLIGSQDDDDTRKLESRAQFIGEVARRLKLIAKEFNICVVALAQLSRAVESRHDKHPVPSDLKESGGIEEAADLIMLLYREEYYNPDCTPELKNVCEINVAKQRNGDTGSISLYFDKKHTRFENLEETLLANI